MNLILGIDPGVSGALALFNPGRLVTNPVTEETRLLDSKVVEVIDVPVFEIQQGKYKRKQVDVHSLVHWLVPRRPRIAKAVIEKVSAMPKDSATGAFTFGDAFGALRGVVAGMLIPVEYPLPKEWKRMFRLGSDKDESRRAASNLFPEAAHYWTRQKDDGRAEAVLMAVFGAKGQIPTVRP